MGRNRQRLRRAVAATAVAAALAPACGIAAGARVVTLPDGRGAADVAAAELARVRALRDSAPGEARPALALLERRVETRRAELLRRAAAGAREHPAAPPPPPPPATTPTRWVVEAGSAGVQRQAELGAISAPTGLATGVAAQIDSYLAAKGSPMVGLGPVFTSAANGVGLDPRLLVAITGAETGFGTYGPSQAIHNPFGLGPGIRYPSWADAIAAAARTLGGQNYLGAGRVTIATIQPVWAPSGATNDPTGLNGNWIANVSAHYAELGGNPVASVFAGVAPTGFVTTTAATLATGNVAAPVAYGAAVPVAGGGPGVGAAAAREALGFLGTPYVWGGASPSGFDCSGLVQYLYGQLGVRLPRVAEAQAQVGIPIPPDQLQAGDAIFFADASGYIHHEGIYLGGGYFVHAPHTGDVVKVSSLYEPYYASQYAGARRY